MLFNTVEFAIFFATLWGVYILLPHRGQNHALLVCSYVFYCGWDYRFASLLIASTVLDYSCGLLIERSSDVRTRKFFLMLSLVGNLGMLGFFKYFGFFVANLELLLSQFFDNVHLLRLDIVIPIGISFYTFQTMSYTIDVYRKHLPATKNFLDFALYVAFFPQLIAGPIERATNLLPQILQPRKITREDLYEGMHLILWGLYLKVFVADNLATIVDAAFDTNEPPNAARTLIACYGFGFQVFGDFGGYSSLAQGVARLMGFRLMDNFNIAFCSTNPSEFWRNWHISLTTWLRDYLYITMGGNRGGTFKTYRNLITTTVLSGIWHGPSWNYVLFGVFHGLLLIFYRIFRPMFPTFDPRTRPWLHRLGWLSSIVLMFHLCAISWPIFRGSSVTQTITMWAAIFTTDYVEVFPQYTQEFALYFAICIPFMIINFVKYYKNDLMYFYNASLPVRIIFYTYMFLCIRFYGVYGGSEFIYFHF